MTHTQKEFQKKLRIERQVLSVQLQKLTNQETGEPVSTVELQMHSKMQVRLASIERALDRLERGTFGACQSCGEQIHNERLIVLPYAEQCIDCQHKLERRLIHQHAYPVH